MSNYNVIIPYYSVMLADSLVPIIQDNYAFKNKIEMELVTSAMNDVYRVFSGSNTYYLKIPRHDRFWPYSKEVYKFELDLLIFCKKQDFPISYPLPLQSKEYLGILNAAEGIRYYELFTEAKGETPDVTNQNHMRLMGSYLANFHTLSNQFKSQYNGLRWDFDLLMDGLKRLQKLTKKTYNEDIQFVVDNTKQLISEINSTLSQEHWGIIHGDYSLKNLKINDDQIMAFDFDSCGYGYQIYDFAPLILKTNYKNLQNKYFQAFLQGYQSVRSLSSAEKKAMLPISKLVFVFNMAANAGFYYLVGSEWFDNKMENDLKLAQKLFNQ